MNVLFICECTGRALKETRRLLDQFAERRGERTWQTAITMNGLEAIRKELRRSARKNTAVACHWIRGRDHSELIWIVGNRNRFNIDGAVPTNTTTRKSLRTDYENTWHSLQDIYLLSALSGLLHDLGKSCAAFQTRLSSTTKYRNLYRHEWISLRLFQSFVGEDDDDSLWLARLASQSPDHDSAWLSRLQKDGIDAKSPTPFKNLPPLAKAIGWLVVTHHRLPFPPPEKGDGFNSHIFSNLPDNITAEWNETGDGANKNELHSYWQFNEPLPVTTRLWRQQAARLATKLLTRLDSPKTTQSIKNPYVMHIARLSLMLADHNYSSLTDEKDRVTVPGDCHLYANTNRNTGEMNQFLDEHLLGVAKHSSQVVHSLPTIAERLPRLARHRGLRKRSSSEQFRWQDRAQELAESIKGQADKNGAFVVNMASTGCGKTLANARIMYALSGANNGMRCAFALGLRTLTRQTGEEYRTRLSLSDDDVATLVGGAAQGQLNEYFKQDEGVDASGSESLESLVPYDQHVIYDGAIEDHKHLRRLCKDPRTKSLIGAPILVCTIDHLIPATESQRGGRQIAPMLRLLSGDLVLDELDDYSIDDLSAVARLMNWAGLLGCRVLISSATLAPALVHGMFEAYSQGRRIFQENRGERPDEKQNICCMWVDEFSSSKSDCGNSNEFATSHNTFAKSRTEELAKAPVLRKSEIQPVDDKPEELNWRQHFAYVIREKALSLHHSHNELDTSTGKKVSFGLVRMANIDPIFDVALELYRLGAPPDFRIHLCVYHSRFPSVLRSAIEHALDRSLNRRKKGSGLESSDVRALLDTYPESNHLFVILSSPVTEVGRDHDYDWAVVEPSSLRSIIQLAGRIQRHRRCLCQAPNMVLLDRNLRSWEQPDQPAFIKPGFESGDSEFRLSRHCLSDLLLESEYLSIDARPRIVEPKNLQSNLYLRDLEHLRLRRLMQPKEAKTLSARELRAGKKNTTGLGAHTWWTEPRSTLSAILQRQNSFRRQSQKEKDLVLIPDEDMTDYTLHYVFKDNKLALVEGYCDHRVAASELSGDRITSWAQADFLTEMQKLMDEFDLDRHRCALRFATVSVPDSHEGWRSSPTLGFSKYKSHRDL